MIMWRFVSEPKSHSPRNNSSRVYEERDHIAGNRECKMSALVGFNCGGAAVNDSSSGQKVKAAEVLG